VVGVSSTFKECDFDARMEGEIHPKALTFPVDRPWNDLSAEEEVSRSLHSGTSRRQDF